MTENTLFDDEDISTLLSAVEEIKNLPKTKNKQLNLKMELIVNEVESIIDSTKLTDDDVTEFNINNVPHIEFYDIGEQHCSLQQSPLAIYETPGHSAIWLGTIGHRMHLTFNQVNKYIPLLQRWLTDKKFRLNDIEKKSKSIKIKEKNGLQLIEFKDHNGRYCALEQSSYELEAAIWFGVIEGNHSFQMHLTFNILNKLIPILQNWIEEGSFDGNEGINDEKNHQNS